MRDGRIWETINRAKKKFQNNLFIFVIVCKHTKNFLALKENCFDFNNKLHQLKYCIPNPIKIIVEILKNT